MTANVQILWGAALNVVAFSRNNQWARHLAKPLLCAYNPDSLSGHAPRAQSLIVPAQFGSRTNSAGFSAGCGRHRSPRADRIDGIGTVGTEET
jgi:hypothetical protein